MRLMVLRRWGSAAAMLLLAACGGSGSGNDGAPAPEPPPRLPGTWSAATPLPESRTEVSATVYEGELYIAGGLAPVGGATAVWVYDPAGEDWRELTTLPEQRHHAGIPMTTPRGAHATVVLDGRIHAIGGTILGASTSVGTHEVYDPASDSWETLAPMTHNRDHLGAAVLDGRIHAAAGRDGVSAALRVLEIYDPQQNAWSSGPPLPTGRSGVGVAVLEGRMYVLGGETFGPAGRTFDEVERYDPGTNAWQQVAPMPTARHGLGAGALGDALHAVAGGPQPGLTYSAVHERLTGL
jgi:N-acetylneuraminic acid mutarotase